MPPIVAAPADPEPLDERSLMDLSRRSMLSRTAWSVDPLGHTEFQIRHFIIKQGNPNADTQYKQVIRELWARWGAFRSNEYEINKSKALLEQQRTKVCLLKWQRMLRDNEVQMLTERIRELEMDQEHRVLRETRVLMDILKELKPSEGDRMDVELDNWAQRGITDKNVRDLLTDQKLLGSRGK